VNENQEHGDVDANKVYTLLALLNYARSELEPVDKFAQYILDMAIVRLSKRVHGEGVEEHADPDMERRH
jgi:hypothetical protein